MPENNWENKNNEQRPPRGRWENGLSFLLGRSQPRPIVTRAKKDFFLLDSQHKTNLSPEKENEYLIQELEHKALLFWQIEKRGFSFSLKQNLLIFFFIFLLTGFGLFTDNLLLSIISILTGLLFWIFQSGENRKLPDTFGITEEGVFANDSFYEFSDLKNFWVFLEIKEQRQELFLLSKSLVQPEIRLPIPPEIAKDIRTILLKYLPEEKPQNKIIDYLNDSLKF